MYCTQADAFHDFCTRRLANLLEQSKQVIQAQYTKSSSEQQSMTSPLVGDRPSHASDLYTGYAHAPCAGNDEQPWHRLNGCG
jgi:hypothetical protein